jgi:hypothetical protein
MFLTLKACIPKEKKIRRQTIFAKIAGYYKNENNMGYRLYDAEKE